MEYKEKTFAVPQLKGISQKTIEEHMKLYAGYVKHANLIQKQIAELAKDSEKNAYLIGELNRRFGFEFDGMRNHEYYFAAFEGGAKPLNDSGALKAALVQEWGSVEAFLNRFKATALTRGIGWAMLYFDPHTKRLTTAWVEEQHLGHLTGLLPVLALDMWEHSFVADYQPSGKKQYVEDFFANLNWDVIEKNYTDAVK